MFAKQNRLAHTRDVQRVFAAGRSFFGPYFTIRFLAAQRPPRITVSISTKVAKSAVRRNKMKRVVREFMRTNLSRLAVGDYLLVVRPATARLTNIETRAGLEQQLLKCRLLRP